MQPLEPAWVNPPETPDHARARLVEELRQRGGRALSRSVQDAFARVPRHVFVPEVGPAAAYRDEAFVIKCGADGLPVSSSSQPAMMAIMLDQLGLRPGHRVLEIGTGSGYNAAVMSAVVGPDGQVVSVDIDSELVGRARTSLATAGFDAVQVLCADGGYGDPAGAPYDRIIVTAGAWDIAPAWLDQLTPDGLLVLPLSVRGIQLSVALRRAPPGGTGTAEDEAWVSTSAWRCGFVRMLGAFAGPETVIQLAAPHALVAQMADGRPVDGRGLQAALAGPPAAAPVGPQLNGLADLADLDLWLTLTGAGLDRVIILGAPGGWFPMASLLPFGGLVSNATRSGRLGVAALLPADGPPWPAAPDVLIRGFGPGGRELAAYLSRPDREVGRAGPARRAGPAPHRAAGGLTAEPGRGAAINSTAS